MLISHPHFFFVGVCAGEKESRLKAEVESERVRVREATMALNEENTRRLLNTAEKALKNALTGFIRIYLRRGIQVGRCTS